jgi:hypothetical protein
MFDDTEENVNDPFVFRFKILTLNQPDDIREEIDLQRMQDYYT